MARTSAVRLFLSFLLLLSIGVAQAQPASKGSRPDKIREPGLRTAVLAAPVIRTISGNPLTVIIGSDTSFQVINAAFPGNGQVYPGDCIDSPADAGIFAHIGGVYFSPNLNEHTCGTAGDPGTPWTEVSLSPVSGTGTAVDPFRVTVVVDAGATGVRMTAVYTYVNGENFFGIAKTFCATSATALQAFLGADIYLAGSDAGIPYLEPASTSPGGIDCGGGGYTILLVPTTPANRYSARGYSTVWAEIFAGTLSNTVDVGCIDNGAALEWQRNVAGGACVTLTSVVSFGAIPPIAQFRVDTVTPAQGAQGQTLTVTVSGIGFQAGTTFNFGAGITVNSTTINSATQATVSLTIAPAATIGFRDVTGTQSPGGLTHTATNAFEVVAAGAATADLGITKTAATPVTPGSNAVFNIAVSNAGPSSATGVTVTDTLPAGLTYVSATTSQGTCSAVGNTVTCSIGTLAAGANASVTITAATGAPGIITNTATVTSTTTEVNPANNTSSVTITVGAVVSVAVPTLDFWAMALLAGLLAAAAMVFVFRN